LLPLLQLALASPAEGEDALPLRAILLAAKTAFYRSGLPIRFEAVGTVVPYDDQLAEAWQLAGEHPLPAFWQIVLCYSYGRNVARDEGLSCLRALAEKLRAGGARWELAFCLHHAGQLIQLKPDDRANSTEAHHYLIEARDILEELGDVRERGYVGRSLGQHHRLREEFAEAIGYWQEAMDHLYEVGEWSIAAFLHWHIGDTYIQMGELDAAFAHYRAMSEAALARGNSSLAGDMLGKESYEAARYGRLDHALETKWLALAHARTAGDLFTEAWTTWEMGELCRLRGELDEAADWFERSLPLFASYDDTTGYVFYHRGLAAVAADRGFHAAAAVNFEKSLRQAVENGHTWSQAYALVGLAGANMALGNLPLAQEQIARAIATASATRDRAITLTARAGAAELLAGSGRSEPALEVAAFVANHPITWSEVRSRAQHLQESLALPEAAIAEATLRVQNVGVWEFVEKLSAELAAILDSPASPPS
jgi:tetratricopeptide (TPR) repeat protein